jgi:hypothetical protein
VIRVLLTDGEYDAAVRVLGRYVPSDDRHWSYIAEIKVKLNEASEAKPVRFTNKEANVLMDALNESEDDAAETLSEKLTGRAS